MGGTYRARGVFDGRPHLRAEDTFPGMLPPTYKELEAKVYFIRRKTSMSPAQDGSSSQKLKSSFA